MQEADGMKSSSIVSCSFCDLKGSEQAQTEPHSRMNRLTHVRDDVRAD